MMQNFGKSVNSFSGFFNIIVNIFFRIYYDDKETLISCLKNDNYGCLGQQAGEFVKAFLSVEVVDFSFGDYSSITEQIGDSVAKATL